MPRPTSVPAVRAPVPAPEVMTAEQIRAAQCSSLRAYALELDAMAQTRTDAATQAWLNNERATTRARQVELRC